MYVFRFTLMGMGNMGDRGLHGFCVFLCAVYCLFTLPFPFSFLDLVFDKSITGLLSFPPFGIHFLQPT